MVVHQLLPPNFKGLPPTAEDVKLDSIIFGITIGVIIFTAWKAVDQTIPMWRRGTARRSPYLWMVWAHLILNSAVSALAWLFMDGVIPMGFPILFVFLVIWIFQVQLPLQIIINRTALLMPNKIITRRLRWGVAVFISLINITVFCIWIPARLQVSQRFIDINNVWDRIEKVLFAIVDLGLNLYFLYIVKSQLIACGLDKYKLLFNFNVGMVVISITMDVLIITLMDMTTPYCYLQFHSLAYLVKLHIEVVMTELIIKIVRFSNSNRGTEESHKTNAEYIPDTDVRRNSTRRADFALMSIGSNRATYKASISAENGQWPLPAKASLFGIEKTVECEVEADESENTIRDIDEELRMRTLPGV